MSDCEMAQILAPSAGPNRRFDRAFRSFGLNLGSIRPG